MANNSVTQLISLINQHVEEHEAISEHLLKAKALIGVALDADFAGLPKVITHGYLWVLSDLVEQAAKLNEDTTQVLRCATVYSYEAGKCIKNIQN